MKNSTIMNIVGFSLISVGLGVIIVNEVNVIRKILKQKDYPTTLEDAGIPGQLRVQDKEHMANADMVSEGSQYGVQYYNKVTTSEE